MPSKSPLQRPALRHMLGVYALIAVWELVSTPTISHSDSWWGVGVSLFALPAGAWWLAEPGTRTSSLFVFGAAGSLLFLFRFVNMDRFGLWLQYQAPSTEVIIICWVLFTLGMGAVCWLAAVLASRC